MVQLPIHYAELETLYLQTLGQAAIPTLALVAPKGGEGVTSLAYALVRRSAAAGIKSLIVETNMAAPVLAQQLRLTTRSWSPDTAISDLPIQRIENTEVYVLPAPPIIDLSWSFRDLNKLRGMLESLNTLFPALILDTSPVLNRNRGNIPANIIAAAANTAVMVTLAGQTREMQVLEAKQDLDTSGAALIGTVINDRFSPALSDELCRETQRLEKYFPGWMAHLRSWLQTTPLLNQEI